MPMANLNHMPAQRISSPTSLYLWHQGTLMDDIAGTGNTGTSGYMCPQCGAWVMWNSTHQCSPFHAPQPAVQPLLPMPGTFQWFVVEPLLTRFVVALERIAAALEKASVADGGTSDSR